MTLDCASLGWNPLISAPLHSALAGVLAGLVFAGIVLLLNVRRDSPRRLNALSLFAGAFLALVFDSFLFGSIAGEQACARGWTEFMSAGGLLGIGTLGMFAGACWLIDDEEGHGHQTTQLFVVTTNIVAIIVGYHLAITATDYLHDLGGVSSPPSWLHGFVSVFKWAVAAFVAARVLVPMAWPRTRTRAVSRGQVSATAYSYVVTVLAALVMSGRAAGIPATQWSVVDDFTIVSTCAVALVLPGITTLMQLLSIPPLTSVRNRRPLTTEAASDHHT